jgi:hypothetical protein
MAKEQFITHDFNLPNHCNELSKAEEVIEKLKKRFEVIQIQHSINDATHLELFEEAVKVLLYIGKLSEPAFEVEDEIEKLYTFQYKHEPCLGKQLWLEHYEEIHHPYTILKNRCFRLLEELDKEYIKTHKKDPPNIKI